MRFNMPSVKCVPSCLALNVLGNDLGNRLLLKLAIGFIAMLLKDIVFEKVTESKWCHTVVNLIGMQR